MIFSIEDFTPVAADEEFEALTELEEARTRWEANGPLNYRYELTVHDIDTASFTDPYSVTVSEGVVVRVESKGQVVDDIPAPALAMEMLFDLIARHAVDGDGVDALYDSKLGYPVFAAIRDAESGHSVLVFSIDRLTPLPSPLRYP